MSQYLLFPLKRVKIVCFYTLVFLLLSTFLAHAQQRCSTVERLDEQFKQNPTLKVNFDASQRRFKNNLKSQSNKNRILQNQNVEIIPVVFHVVLKNQSMVTDAQLMAQLDTINKDFSGSNASRINIPDHFKGLFGQTNIQFTTAKRTPTGVATNGIIRYNTNVDSFSSNDENVKTPARGGAASWNTDDYLNIWICDLGSRDIGYATFPGAGDKVNQGVVISYLGLPDSPNGLYNGGKTLTHELGHFFNLYHIWGDDYGSCDEDDDIMDTPLQGDFTSTIQTGIYPDYCADRDKDPAMATGRMYQNYMDYTPDVCLMMFTKDQTERIAQAFEEFRSSYRFSQGHIPTTMKNFDAGIQTIQSPAQRLCEGIFKPRVILKNLGFQPLTSVEIHAVIENGNRVKQDWRGFLAPDAEVEVELPALSVTEGDFVLSAYTTLPNGVPDEEPLNDAEFKNFMYYLPIEATIQEGFENEFPAKRWDMINADNSYTWEKTSLASYSGANSIRIRNSVNTTIGTKDELRSPDFKVAAVDSAFVVFQLAASPNAVGNRSQAIGDTLEVFISSDCGLTKKSVFKKWGDQLFTTTETSRAEFVPSWNQWRKEKINITDFVPADRLMVIISNVSGNGNNIYLDDFEISTVTVNPILKKEGFLVSPNPTEDVIRVQFYPHPTALSSLTVYNVKGQIVKQKLFESGMVNSNEFEFDLSHNSPGIYIVQANLGTQTLTKKVIVK
jgi:hypothetical protein